MERYFTNQFHLVELECPEPHNFIRGRIYSWDWGLNSWERSTQSIMPYYAGFGASSNPHDIAKMIDTVMISGGHFTVEQLMPNIPDLHFLTPTQLSSLKEILDLTYSITTYVDEGQVQAFFRET